MKNQSQRKSTRPKFPLRWQLCNPIPNDLAPQLVRTHAVQEKSRSLLPWRHLVSLIYAQLTHARSLNNVSDALRLRAGPLTAIHIIHPMDRVRQEFACQSCSSNWGDVRSNGRGENASGGCVSCSIISRPWGVVQL